VADLEGGHLALLLFMMISATAERELDSKICIFF
jgi:hypothetical protein